MVLVVGVPTDALFALVLVFNTLIGIAQEVRAKWTLDRLNVLIDPVVTVIRDGNAARLNADELVLGDLIRLVSGDQVPVDGRVIDERGFEVDESALTGESNPVPKSPGDAVLSGSAIVSGSASVVATAVGEDAWVRGLEAQAKKFVLTKSELRVGVDRILRYVGWVIVPLGALLLWSQLRGGRSTSAGLISTVAGLVGLVPQGLVLLVSMAMAVAVTRLARHKVVVQELNAVEGLARIDVICLDKTGTLTTGKFDVEALEPFEGSVDEMREALAALAAAEADPTETMRVLSPVVGPAPSWQALHQVAFSSARKWSGASFDGEGAWVLGAPEILLDAASDAHLSLVSKIRERQAELAENARRVLLLAHADVGSEVPFVDDALPSDLTPIGLVVLSEQVRVDAAETMKFFADQGVTVKVISGDNPQTVSTVASRLGGEGAAGFVDMRGRDAPFDSIVRDNAVFGRVLPDQKRELVEALQRAGNVVAMTGDGVNDIPALKRADIGIAMETATPATKAVAQIVLLDGRFDRLPHVVAEGRRVVANMERVSSLFVTKTIYSFVFAVTFGITGSAFLFLPRHVSLVSDLTIGIPAFLLSFRAADQPCRPGYLTRVMRFAIPAGVVAAASTVVVFAMARSQAFGASLPEARTAATFALSALALWILYRLIRPADRFDGLLMVALIGGILIAVATPWFRRFYALDFPSVATFGACSAFVVGTMLAVEVVDRGRGRGRPE